MLIIVILAGCNKPMHKVNIKIEGKGEVAKDVVNVVDQENMIQETDIYPEGTMLSLTPIPAEGWKFSEWDDYGVLSSPINSTWQENQTFIVSNDVILKAKFIKIQSIKINIDGDGEIYRYFSDQNPTSEPLQLIKMDEKTKSYNHSFAKNTKLNLIAYAPEGWVFDYWEIENNKKKTINKDIKLNVELDKDKKIKAIFSKMKEPLNVTIKGSGYIYKKKLDNNKIKLVAIPKKGWELKQWTKGLKGSEVEKVVSIDSQKNIGLEFEKQKIKLKIYRSKFIKNIKLDGELIGSAEENTVDTTGGEHYIVWTKYTVNGYGETYTEANYRKKIIVSKENNTLGIYNENIYNKDIFDKFLEIEELMY